MNLDIIPNGAIKRVHLSQGDIGRTLTFNLFNGSTQYDVPIGATVKIQGTKPSGFGFSETCTVSGNTVTVDTTEEMTDEYGYIDTELQITDSGDVIGTSNFILAIERNPHPDNITDGTQITAQSLEVRIEALEESALGGLTDEAKQALLNCFAHVAWIDEDGQDYYDALEDALYPPANLVSISCVYTQSGTVYDTDSLDSLKSDLVVTAHYDNSTTQTVTTYTLSGSLTVGTSTVTVSYGGKTTTFNVTVTEAPTDTTVQLDTDHMDKGQSSTFGTYNNKTGWCPSIKYELSTTAQSTYDYVCGIVPADGAGSSTGRAWWWFDDSTGEASSAYGSGKPIQDYSESMTEGSVSFTVSKNFAYLTIPVGVDYVDDAYLYIQSNGVVLFAGKNTPYYGMSNISEAS